LSLSEAKRQDIAASYLHGHVGQSHRYVRLHRSPLKEKSFGDIEDMKGNRKMNDVSQHEASGAS
jgi:hypothetical protein